VRTARFAPTGSQELGPAAVEALTGRRAVLLARHGVLALGESPARALDVCAAVERQALIAWLLR
jgi:ribulose-5-phosphate 4-epimerase/fuculose-1-phosphate aldolase